MTLNQLLETAAELGVHVPPERMEASLRQAQLRRIERLSAGRPRAAAQLYAAAAAADPHVSTYHLLLGSELASLRNLSGATAALSTAISCIEAARADSPQAVAGEGGHEIVRARLLLALCLEHGLIRATPDDSSAVLCCVGLDRECEYGREKGGGGR